jgi:hypothetical protein
MRGKSVIDQKSRELSSIFDLTTLIKIVVEDEIDIETNKSIKLNCFIAAMESIRQHPCELLYKWVGVYYLHYNNPEMASRMFDQAILVAEKLGFTVATIALSPLALKGLGMENDCSFFETKLRELSEQSDSFAEYIHCIGGIDQMKMDIEDRNIKAITRWLPFGYS